MTKYFLLARQEHKIRSFFLVTFLVFVGCVVLTSAFAAGQQKPQVARLDKIVAVVNNDVITQSELTQKINAMKIQLTRTNELVPENSVLRQKALDSLIDSSLLLQLAKRNNIEVSDADFNRAIENIAKSNKMSVTQLKETFAKEGIDFEAFSKQTREEMVSVRLYQQAFGREIVVNDKEIAEVMHHPAQIDPNLQEYHVIDILILTPDQATPEQNAQAKKKALHLLDQLNEGADLTKIVTADKTLKSDDLGWRRLAALPTIFANEVMKMKVSAVAGPVAAPNGLHLLKLIAIRGQEKQLQLTKEQAQELVYRKKIQEHSVSWLKEVRANAYIKIME